MSNRHLDENSNIVEVNSDDEIERLQPPRRMRRMIQRSESFSVCDHKQAVFQYDKDQLYELLLQHGVSILICDRFLCKI